MKKLNIAFVCDPLTHFTSGAIVSTIRFAELLKKEGHKVIFLAGKGNETKEIDYLKGIKVYRSKSINLPGSNGEYIMAFPSLKKVKEIFRNENIDIVHLMDPYPSSLIAIIAARKLGIRVVAHSHFQPEAQVLQNPPFLRLKIITNLLYFYLKWFYNRADRVICPSNFTARNLKKHGCNKKLFIISNGVELSRFKPVSYYSFMNKHNLNKKDFQIVFVGRLQSEKNVETLINSLSYIIKYKKDVHLNIIGKGNLRNSLEGLTKSLGLSDNITFYGKVSDADLIKIYSLGDLFVLPSIAELEGMVVLEAMAMGLPVVISDSKLSASSDFVNKNGFIFKTNSSKDLSIKILKFINNSPLKTKMAKQSLENVKDYDINNSIKKLLSVYYDLSVSR